MRGLTATLPSDGPYFVVYRLGLMTVYKDHPEGIALGIYTEPFPIVLKLHKLAEVEEAVTLQAVFDDEHAHLEGLLDTLQNSHEVRNTMKKFVDLRYYAVGRGKNTGIYLRWDGRNEAKEQILGFCQQKHKLFLVLADALVYYMCKGPRPEPVKLALSSQRSGMPRTVQASQTSSMQSTMQAGGTLTGQSIAWAPTQVVTPHSPAAAQPSTGHLGVNIPVSIMASLRLGENSHGTPALPSTPPRSPLVTVSSTPVSSSPAFRNAAMCSPISIAVSTSHHGTSTSSSPRLQERFSSHNIEYYHQEVMQRSHLVSLKRKVSRWNVFQCMEVQCMNQALPAGTLHKKASAYMAEISATWNVMSEADKLKATAKHNAPINVFHDARSTLNNISRELEGLSQRTGTETNDCLPEYFYLKTKTDILTFAIKMESYGISGMEGVVMNHVEEILDLKWRISALIIQKLHECYIISMFCMRLMKITEDISPLKISKMYYKGFEKRITARYRITVVNWPLKEFKSPGDISHKGDLQLLYRAWESSTTHFKLLSNEEHKKWEEEQFQERMWEMHGPTAEDEGEEDELNGVLPTSPVQSPAPESTTSNSEPIDDNVRATMTINEGAGSANNDTSSPSSAALIVGQGASSQMSSSAKCHAPANGAGVHKKAKTIQPLSSFINIVTGADGNPLTVQKKTRKECSDKGMKKGPRKKQAAGNENTNPSSTATSEPAPPVSVPFTLAASPHRPSTHRRHVPPALASACNTTSAPVVASPTATGPTIPIPAAAATTPGTPSTFAPGGAPSPFVPDAPSTFTPGDAPSTFVLSSPSTFVPSSPSIFVPGAPATSAPSAPATSALSAPSIFVPGAPSIFAPGAPTTSVPSAPATSAPGAPATSVPSASATSAPGAPATFAPGISTPFVFVPAGPAPSPFVTDASPLLNI
ncbi:hypothetical protein SCP_0901440 [Sparassis crispa]|uniref:Ribonuclease H1 N-terminal domain-containing protein n=1 Tax=Sparassis crispa TaxID=139825 RepID=A0A401GVL8_9APHY|nr:hypothetical protein SCP_0901440 [Sparassis crispa]GBE86265.1 hypothetical protein SCP_0901440 [Sparassis crispa]